MKQLDIDTESSKVLDHIIAQITQWKTHLSRLPGDLRRILLFHDKSNNLATHVHTYCHMANMKMKRHIYIYHVYLI